MKLYPINTGHFKLDGGAMFGVVPKSIWQNANTPDSNNMCSWALRCLLIEDGDRLILIDNGIGDKQSEKFFSYFYLFGDDTLTGSLKKYGFTPDDITDVFLTHLHFDHCGGGIVWNSDRSGFDAMFKNATYWSNSRHWKWATEPNPRERASFLKENIMPMEKLGQLKFTDKDNFDLFNIKMIDGHTEQQMLPMIEYKDQTIVFMADLLPSAGHIPLPYVMAYDTRPLLSMKEKAQFLDEAVKNNYILFLEHDPVNECCTVKQTEKGIRLGRLMPFSEI